jgi:hypothetical protein
MNSHPLLAPFVAMMVLTAVVWVAMYALRLPYLLRSKVDLQSIATPEQMNAYLPAWVNNPSNNLKNLFEMPVLFYALVLALVVTGNQDPMMVKLAWAYAGLRAAHSLIHCTVNIVNLRFTAYLLSSVALLVMIGRFASTAL